jgi:hypothetical protein
MFPTPEDAQQRAAAAAACPHQWVQCYERFLTADPIYTWACPLCRAVGLSPAQDGAPTQPLVAQAVDDGEWAKLWAWQVALRQAGS